MATEHPTRYNIEALLASGIQPFPDSSDDDFIELRKSLGKKPLAVPVSISSDNRLLDGHQRLRALLANGRKWLDASEVRIIADANESNAVESTIRPNVQRRHVSTESNAALARQ